MRRVFLEGEIADTMEVRGADAHHLQRVMRAKLGKTTTFGKPGFSCWIF